MNLLRYSQLLISYRWVVILTSLAVAVFASSGLRHLQFDPDLRSLYDPEHPQMVELGEVEEEFSKRDTLMIILAVKNGTVFEPYIAELIRDITDEAWKLPYAVRVDSISNFQQTRADEDDLLVENLLPEFGPIDAASLQRARFEATKNLAIKRILVSDAGDVASININLQARDNRELVAAMPEFIAAAEDLIARYSLAYPDIEFLLGGEHAINSEMQQHSNHDSTVLIPLMLGVMVALLFVLLRCWYSTLCSAVIVVLTGLSSIGLVAWLGVQVDVASAIAPIVIMTLAVADAVHLVNGVSQGKSSGLSLDDSISSSLQLNFKPIFLTSVTTVLGVLTFSFTDFPPLRNLALMLAIGVSAAFVFSVTLLPALLSLGSVKGRANAALGPVLQRLVAFSIGHPKAIAIASMLALLIAIPLIPRNTINESPKLIFEETTKASKMLSFIDDNLAGLGGTFVAVYGDGDSTMTEPENIELVASFVDWVRQREAVGHVGTITDTLKQLNKSMHGDQDDYYRLPNQRDAIAQYLLLYELSLPAGLELTHQINLDKSGVLLSITGSNLSSAQVLEEKAAMYQWFENHAPHLRVVVTGLTQTSSELAMNTLVPSMLRGGAIAIFTVSLVLLIALASIRLGLLGMLAACFPIALGYAGWALYSGMMGFAVASVAGLCLGVVVDFAIHFLSKYRTARREGQSTAVSIEYAYATVARAIWITTVVLVSGFWILTISEIGLNSSLGLLTGCVILLAAVFILLCLPAFLMLFDRSEGQGVEQRESV